MALNRIRFYEVKKIIADYKKGVDAAVSKYKNSVKWLEGNKHIYSDSYYSERKEELAGGLRSLVSAYRKTARQKIQPVLEGMQLDVDAWVAEPVDNNFLQRINTIKAAGLELGAYEAKALIDSAHGNYMAGRLLYALINPKQEESPVDAFAYYENGAEQPRPARQPQKEIPLEFMNMCEPNVQNLVKDFETLKSRAGIILDYYSGADMCSALFKGDLAGAAPYMSAAQNDYSAEIDNIANKWADTMLKNGQKLSGEERKWINSNFESCKCDFDKKGTAAKLIGDMPEIKNLLEVSEYADCLG